MKKAAIILAGLLAAGCAREAPNYSYRTVSNSSVQMPAGYQIERLYLTLPDSNVVAAIIENDEREQQIRAALEIASGKRSLLGARYDSLQAVFQSLSAANDSIFTAYYNAAGRAKAAKEFLQKVDNLRGTAQQYEKRTDDYRRELAALGDVSDIRQQINKLQERKKELLRQGAASWNGIVPAELREPYEAVKSEIHTLEKRLENIGILERGIKGSTYQAQQITDETARIEKSDAMRKALACIEDEKTVFDKFDKSNRRNNDARDEFYYMNRQIERENSTIAQLQEKLRSTQRKHGIAIYRHGKCIYIDESTSGFEGIDVGNVDGDKEAEIAVYNDNLMRVFDIKDGSAREIFHEPYSRHAGLYDMDGNRRQEIVLAGNTVITYSWNNEFQPCALSEQLIQELNETVNNMQLVAFGDGDRREKERGIQRAAKALDPGLRTLALDLIQFPDGNQLTTVGNYKRENYAYYTDDAMAFGTAVDAVLDIWDPTRVRKQMPAIRTDPNDEYFTDSKGNKEKMYTSQNPWGWLLSESGGWSYAPKSQREGAREAFIERTGREPTQQQLEQTYRTNAVFEGQLSRDNNKRRAQEEQWAQRQRAYDEQMHQRSEQAREQLDAELKRANEAVDNFLKSLDSKQ